MAASERLQLAGTPSPPPKQLLTKPIHFVVGKEFKTYQHGDYSWLGPIKRVGVSSFVDMVKAHEAMDSLQEHACERLIQELLLTKFGIHIAAELKCKGIKPVLECIDGLLIHKSSPNMKEILYTLKKRHHALALKGWTIDICTYHSGYRDTQRVITVRHEKWTENEQWDTEKIGTHEAVGKLLRAICTDLGTYDINEDVNLIAIEETWLGNPCEVGPVEFVELIARGIARDKFPTYSTGRQLQDTLLALLSDDIKPMNLVEFLAFCVK